MVLGLHHLVNLGGEVFYAKWLDNLFPDELRVMVFDMHVADSDLVGLSRLLAY